jgi:hypothetical protein
MFPGDIKVGYVFRYSYLWHRQHVAGRREGDKDRPCLVLALVRVNEDGRSIVRVLPITHSPPNDPDTSIEIPRAVKVRLKLDDEQSWIVVSESNRFIWPGPDIRPLDTPDGYYGPLPPALFGQVRQRFVMLARNESHLVTPRSA